MNREYLVACLLLFAVSSCTLTPIDDVESIDDQQIIGGNVRGVIKFSENCDDSQMHDVIRDVLTDVSSVDYPNSDKHTMRTSWFTLNGFEGKYSLSTYYGLALVRQIKTKIGEPIIYDRKWEVFFLAARRPQIGGKIYYEEEESEALLTYMLSKFDDVREDDCTST